ncbi:hypothetical protein [Mycoplasmopsis agassizii]|uniref:Uncharacterized protein n=1 Tax=Mycoplasmopsis agassizii TaxID=33922 RepID=A0ABX4H4H3_9BACT|nr:hypothetical protein [Mycoplasmopsis agassizii]PAF54796.1 hypothetical protein CJF60_03610 [Mycoplasmopsis agassizii]SMC19263.1 hypothetical protein SAMN02745179_00864 [Mycoplasmopsis agassizii]
MFVGFRKRARRNFIAIIILAFFVIGAIVALHYRDDIITRIQNSNQTVGDFIASNPMLVNWLFTIITNIITWIILVAVFIRTLFMSLTFKAIPILLRIFVILQFAAIALYIVVSILQVQAAWLYWFMLFFYIGLFVSTLITWIVAMKIDKKPV